MAKYKQGIYTPVHPEKWVITKTFDMKEACIKYRSSWEKSFAIFCDMNNNIVKANSEGMRIKYNNPITGKISNYYLDFIIETKDGTVFLVEIKPKAQCVPPRKPRKNTKKAQQNYIKAIETYTINKAKWDAAERFCQEKGFKFQIITEKELGL